MSEKTDTDNIRTSQVLAGALAAVTAALLGSTMGVAGTVVGAGLASIVSTVGGALYLRSIQRTRDGVRTVRAKVVGRVGGATVMVSPADPDDPPAPGEETSSESPPAPRRLRWPTLVAGSVLAFTLGMLAITGVEWVKGESLSGGAGTTFGSIVKRDNGNSTPDQQQSPSNGPSTPPASTTTGTSTSPTSPTSPTTTTTPPSDSSTSTTTTTTTTSGSKPTEPPGGTVPPSN